MSLWWVLVCHATIERILRGSRDEAHKTIFVGFGGLTTSIALAEYGHKVTILERNPTLSPWGGTVVLGPQISKALERYGMLAEFQTVAGGFSQASCHRRWKTGEIIVRSPAQGTDKTFGYRYVYLGSPCWW